MSVRTQFWILIAAVVLTPVLVVGSFVFMQSGFQWPARAAPVTANFHIRQAERVVHWLETGGDRPERVAPNWIDLVVWDQAGHKVLYQTVGDAGITPEQVRDRFDVVFSHFDVDDRQRLVGLISSPASWQPETFLVRPELLILGSIPTVVGGVCLWILLTMRKRLRVLRLATERIAEGDLETELPAPANDDFGTLTHSFNEMRRRLKTAMEGRDRLIMSVTHDLKTPLASIKGYTDALRDGLAPTPEEVQRYLGIIADKSDLLEYRVQDLIDYVKLSGSQWRLELEPIPLGVLIDEWFSQIEQELRLGGRTMVRLNRLEPTDQVVADPALLLRALENLVSNARQYSQPDSAIHLVARKHYDHLILEVGNEGDALAKDDAQQLFEAFYRADKGRNQSGLGLGLTVVATIMELHGGQVRYHHEGGINWFQLTWPRETA